MDLKNQNPPDDQSNKKQNRKGIFLVRIKLKDVFGFADQVKITQGLGYSLNLKRNSNNFCIIRTAGVDAAIRYIKDIGW